MTTSNRDAAGKMGGNVLDDVSIPQPKPSASKLSVPVLHGLTLNQLEAIRGYVDVCASVNRVYANVSGNDARTSPPEPWEVDVVSVEFKAIAKGYDGDTSPYSDGARYALSTPRVASQLRAVEALLVEWKR